MSAADTLTYTQKFRRIAVLSPLGEDVLMLRGFHGEDGISQLFRFHLDLFSANDGINFDQIVGQSLTLRITLVNGEQRYFNGLASRFSQGGRDQEFTTYYAEIVPSLYLLTRTTDCRIFQNKTTPEIIKLVLKDYAAAIPYRDQLHGTFASREYCVQYRETDFHFLSRLMEEEGIFYYFVHENGVHTLILANVNDGLPDCPHQPEARYHYTSALKVISEDVVDAWQTSQDLRPGAYTLNDYNFEDPHASLEAHVPGRNTHEIYDYPGLYRRHSEGAALARVRLQETEATRVLINGGSDCRAFTSGHKFKLTEHYRADQNQAYLLTRVQHVATQSNDYRSGQHASAQAESHYRNTFDCIPLATPFRPLRVTPKPVIQGSQTAIVTGEKGEEITTDKYGRVKVQFHWDREGEHDEKSSCWIRVSQLWAGPNWGSVSIPRIGQEVIVSFLEGDPDRPLITGCVYNAEYMPPYTLPANADMMGFRSNSTKGGGGYNEIVIRDGKAGEYIRIYGQKDMMTTVLHDQKELVKNNKNIHVVQELRTKVDGKVSHTIKGDLAENLTQNHAEVVQGEYYVKAGRIVLEAGQEICLKVGDNHIQISAAGVFVDGTMIDLNCGHPAPNTTIGGLTPTPPDDPA